MSEQNNTQLNINNVSQAWGIEIQNGLVNNVFSQVKGFCHADLREMLNTMTAPFSQSPMYRNSVIGGGYRLGSVELHKDEPFKNKSHILDEMTLEKLSKESLEHLYFTNGVYATSKSLVIEEANRFAQANNCDEVRFTNNGRDYSMFEAEFDFYYRGHKRFTRTIKVEDKSIIRCKKENLRGFVCYDVDIDNVDYERAVNLCNDIDNGTILMPTCIIVTGTGVHLKYVFTKPVYLMNKTVLKQYETMQGMFSRIFTHNARYCGKLEEAGSFQRDLPLGQPMRAVGNIYDKIDGVSIVTEGYTSGVYYDIETLNTWAKIPEIKIAKIRSSQQYNLLKTRKLSETEYQKLKDSFIGENVHYRTQHRNLLFYYMLVKEELSFEDALREINEMVDELNRTRPVEGNYVRHLIEREANKFNPYSEAFDYSYYTKHLSTSAIVNTPIYRKWIKKQKHCTGLTRAENAAKVGREVIKYVPQKAEKFLYALLNTIQGTKDNYTEIVNYHGEQCVINDYDFTPFVMSHSNHYELGTDIYHRELKRLYDCIEHNEDEKSQKVIKTIYDYLNDIKVQHVGSTNLYSLGQQFIHKFLLASTPQSFRDEYYNRFVGYPTVRKYTIRHEYDFREINAYLHSLKTLTHHHFEKIRDGHNATPLAYITGDILDYNWTRVDETIIETQKLLESLRRVREEALKTTNDRELINEIIKTNNKSNTFRTTEAEILQESWLRRIHFESIKLSNINVNISERIRLYCNVVNLLDNHQEIQERLDFDTLYNIYRGMHLLNYQAKKNRAAFIQEIQNHESELFSKLDTIQFIDNRIRDNVNKFSEGKRKYHGTFMYMCYMRGYIGFYDKLAHVVTFPYYSVFKHPTYGLEHCVIGRELLKLDDSEIVEYKYPIWNFKLRMTQINYNCALTLRTFVVAIMSYIQKLKLLGYTNTNIVQELRTVDNELSKKVENLLHSAQAAIW